VRQGGLQLGDLFAAIAVQVLAGVPLSTDALGPSGRRPANRISVVFNCTGAFGR
jgi:hypothetical protein